MKTGGEEARTATGGARARGVRQDRVRQDRVRQDRVSSEIPVSSQGPVSSRDVTVTVLRRQKEYLEAKLRLPRLSKVPSKGTLHSFFKFIVLVNCYHYKSIFICI